MAKTVGLPVAIATMAILNEKITTPGVQMPLSKEVYDPNFNRTGRVWHSVHRKRSALF